MNFEEDFTARVDVHIRAIAQLCIERNVTIDTIRMFWDVSQAVDGSAHISYRRFAIDELQSYRRG